MSNHIKIFYNLCKTESEDTRSHKTVEEKLKLHFYSIENSINKGAEKFGVERKSIRKLREQLPKLTEMPR